MWGENNCVWTAFSWCSVLNFRDTHEVRSVVVCIRWKVPLVLHVLLWTTQTTQWLLGSQVNGFYTNRWVTNRTLWQFIIQWHQQFTQGHFTDDDSSYTGTVYQWYWYTVVINWYFYFYPSLWQIRSKLSNLHTVYIYFYKLSVQKLSLCKLLLHNENQWLYELNIPINMQWQLNLCNGSLQWKFIKFEHCQFTHWHCRLHKC